MPVVHVNLTARALANLRAGKTESNTRARKRDPGARREQHVICEPGVIKNVNATKKCPEFFFFENDTLHVKTEAELGVLEFLPKTKQEKK